jgi:hypothetical protein
MFLVEHPEYEHVPVTMREFLNNPFYTPPEDNRRPNTEKILCEIFDTGNFETLGDYEEALLIMGIGAGKSFLASKSMHYMAYRLLCLKSPPEYFKFGIGTRIAFINISKSYSQAKDVVFGEIKNRIDNSKWFQKYYPPDPRIKSLIRLPKDIYILPVGSNEEAPLGYNIFGAVIDEASFHVITKDKDYAEESYNQIKKRIRSRFLSKGKLFIITSPRYTYDFAETKFTKDTSPTTYKRRTPLWEALPQEYFGGKKFDLATYLPTYKKWKKERRMVPIEYEQEFKQNPEKAMRDYGAQPSLAIQGLFRDPAVVSGAANRKRKHPVDQATGDFYEWFHNKQSLPDYSSEPRYIHVDLGLNKGGKGDCAGIAMAHFDGWQEYRLPSGYIERRPKIFIDYMEQITAGPKGEILFSDIRKKIYRLKEIGYNIALISMDGWNSTDSLQQLRDAGFKTELLSVDRNVEPYYTMKAAILEGRLDFYPYDIFIKEAQQLEEVNGRKIDHPGEGCLTAETEIRLLNGTKKTIKDLADMGADHKFWVYSCMPNGKIIPQLAYNARKTKTASQIVRVTLDNGKMFRCTEDHRILLRNGEYKSAGELAVGESLMPFDVHNRVLKYTNGGRSEYQYVRDMGEWVATHRLVSDRRGFSVRNNNEVIHHYDLDSLNNVPDNLIRVTRSEHAKIHERITKFSTKPDAIRRRIQAFKKTYRNSPRLQKIFHDNGVRWQKNCGNEARRKSKISYIRNKDKIIAKQKETLIRKYGSVGVASRHLTEYAQSDKGRRCSRGRAKWLNDIYWKTPHGVRQRKILSRTQLSNALRKRIVDEDERSITKLGDKFEYILGHRHAMYLAGGYKKAWTRRLGRMDFAKNAERLIGLDTISIERKTGAPIGLVECWLKNINMQYVIGTSNHKVAKISRLSGKFDVYDISIYNGLELNFGLRSGVFVHNSKDVSDAVAGTTHWCSKRIPGSGVLGA